MLQEFPKRDDSSVRLVPRLRWAAPVMIGVMVILGLRLWHLQLIRGESYEELSENNRVRVIRLPPSRGRILDCRGQVLADNSPSFLLSVVRSELRDSKELVETCSPILGIPQEDFRSRFEKSSSAPRFLAYPLHANLSLEQVSLIKTRMADLKGVELDVKPSRVYPGGPGFCHMIGTIGQISKAELSGAVEAGYRSGDMVGKTGIEKEYEPYLKGMEGWEQIEIDAKARQLGTLSVRPPEQGADVVLTVDAEFQRYVDEIFVHRAGSIVAVDPETGNVLAMVSRPGYDPNLFSGGISRRAWNDLTGDVLHPLEDRSIRGLYSAASTFKIVTAAAALGERVVKPEDTFTCKGALELAGQRFRCWNHYGHGKVSMRRAIVESCDIYFYELGLRLGPERIAKYAALFGLGKPTGLGLPQELPGLIPTPAWKQRTYGDSWKDGETLNMAIGQGYMVSTPIQMAIMTAAVANGGNLLKPGIVSRIQAPDGKIVHEHSPLVRWKIPLSDSGWSILRGALEGVVSDKVGTGRRCRIPRIKVAGKTGTSQVVRHKQRMAADEEAPYHERTHAIFVAYVDDMPKKIAVVVVVEHGGAGGSVAAPLARKVICRYYGVPDPGDSED